MAERIIYGNNNSYLKNNRFKFWRVYLDIVRRFEYYEQ
jgi:hypothetical protein